jgi:DNA gyrase subunit B
VRIAVMKMLHGMGTTRYLPREFFETNEYRHIMALSAKLDDLLGEDAFISRGDRQGAVEHFSEAVDWLMNEARRGQSVQRYKGLGEMNPKADEIFTTLMGDQVEPRREFIEKNALTVSNLDV